VRFLAPANVRRWAAEGWPRADESFTSDGNRKKGSQFMTRNVVRGILNLVFAAAAAWLANFLVEKMFGPEELEEEYN
jgi:hypothetical protein